MRTSLLLKKTFLMTLCTCMFLCGLMVFGGQPQTAKAEGRLRMSTSSSSVELNVRHCATMTVRGDGFTPSSFNANYAVFTAIDQYATVLAVNPSRVAVPFGGNFLASVEVCRFTPWPTETMNFSMTDAQTGRAVGPAVVTVYAPYPSITAPVKTVSLENGCATVSLLGTQFISPEYGTSSAFIYGNVMGRRQSLVGSPALVPVYSGGTVVASVRYCGLVSGDTLALKAMDGVSWLFSNNILLTVM